MKFVLAQIVTIGDELLAGDTLNTNLQDLAQLCRHFGIRVQRAISVGDHPQDIMRVFYEAASSCDLCLVSGGLGPTCDDQTAAALAHICEVKLAIQTGLKAIGREPLPGHLKQADLPPGAIPLANSEGTAPGFALRVCTEAKTPNKLRILDFHSQQKSCLIICLPGVPRELQAMLKSQVQPLLRATLPLQSGFSQTYRVIGMPESMLADKLEPLWAASKQQFLTSFSPVSLHYRAADAEVLLHFEASGLTEKTRQGIETAWGSFHTSLLQVLSPHCYGWGNADLAKRIVHVCTAANLRISVAESCTGGRLSSLLTSVPGSSACFLGGVISYANSLKEKLLNVPGSFLERYGAVSEQVARAMADGIRARTQSDWGIGITGIAGPTGGSQEKPVGTVDIAISQKHGNFYQRYSFSGSRDSIQTKASQTALKQLWDCLTEEGLCSPFLLD